MLQCGQRRKRNGCVIVATTALRFFLSLVRSRCCLSHKEKMKNMQKLTGRGASTCPWTLSRRIHWTALEHIVQGPRRPWNGRCLEEYGAVWSRQGCFRAAPDARVVYRREVHHKAPHLGIVHVDEDRSCFGSERIIHVIARGKKYRRRSGRQRSTRHEHLRQNTVLLRPRQRRGHPARTVCNFSGEGESC